MNRPEAYRCMAKSQTNLEPDSSSYVGRGAQHEALRDAFSEHALVTLHGPAGAGKTRTAREFAVRQLDQGGYDQAWFCGLSDARSRADVVDAVAEALGLPADDDVEARLERLEHALASREGVLLVLDNAEQVADDVAELAGAWLDADDVSILVTSRVPTGAPAEVTLSVGPLDTDDAVRLFVERARYMKPDFEPSSAVREQIVELIEHLDCLPLGIELAAARIDLFPPAEIVKRLDERFRILAPTRRPGPGRREALENAVAWSWDLLDDAERDAARQLAVFRGGFSLQAAQSVVEPEDPAVWVPELVESLRDNAFIRSVEDATPEGEVRFDFYQTMHAFVTDRAAPPTDLRRRHAEFVVDDCEQWAERVGGSQAADALVRLRSEEQNLRHAYEYGVDHDAKIACRAARCLDAFYRRVGRKDLHADILDRAIEAGADVADDMALHLRLCRGELHLDAGELAKAKSCFERVANEPESRPHDQILAAIRLGEILRREGAPRDGAQRLMDAARAATSEALQRLALAYASTCFADQHRLDDARDVIEELRAISTTDALDLEVEVNRRLAYTQYYLQNHEEQRRLSRRALDLARQLGDDGLVARCLQGLASCELAVDDYEAAAESYRQTFELHERHGNRYFAAVVRGNLAGALHRLGEFDAARDAYVEAISSHRAGGTSAYEAVALFGLGTLEFELGHQEDARAYFEQALEIAEASDDHYDAAALHLCLAWRQLSLRQTRDVAEHIEVALEWLADDGASWPAVAEATRAVLLQMSGDVDDAQAAMSRADESLVHGRHPTEHALVDLLALARAVLAEELDDEQVEARLSELSTRHQPARRDSVVNRRLHARIVACLVRRLAQGPRAPRQAATRQENQADALHAFEMRVGPKARWFQTPGGEEVDLRRRKSIRLVLDHLVRMHEDDGEATDVHALFDIGWPGDKAAPDTAAERVYWAIRTLRKLGLEDLIITTDDGYLLDPDARVERDDS